jgi:hypothetical protein
MPKQSTKRQHYVSRFYLQQWADADRRVYVFDKSKCEVRRQHIKEVAHERYFYDFSDEVLSEMRTLLDHRADLTIEKKAQMLNPQLVENRFAHLEDRFKGILTQVIQGLDETGEMIPALREELALFVTLQYVRVPRFRWQIIELQQTMLSQESVSRARVGFTKQNAAYEHARLMFNPELIGAMVAILLGHVWWVGVTGQDRPWYTSDDPIVQRSLKAETEYGIDSAGVELAFPLSPRYLLILAERTHMQTLVLDMSTLEGKALPLDSNTVDYYNKGQVRQSLRQVYGSVDSFSLAQDVCEAEPQFRKPPQEYVKMRPRPDSPSQKQAGASTVSATAAKGGAAKGKTRLPAQRRPTKSKRRPRR